MSFAINTSFKEHLEWTTQTNTLSPTVEADPFPPSECIPKLPPNWFVRVRARVTKFSDLPKRDYRTNGCIFNEGIKGSTPWQGHPNNNNMSDCGILEPLCYLVYFIMNAMSEPPEWLADLTGDSDERSALVGDNADNRPQQSWNMYTMPGLYFVCPFTFTGFSVLIKLAPTTICVVMHTTQQRYVVMPLCWLHRTIRVFW